VAKVGRKIKKMKNKGLKKQKQGNRRLKETGDEGRLKTNRIILICNLKFHILVVSRTA